MDQAVIEGVTVVPGDGRPAVEGATVVLDAAGVVESITGGARPSDRFLVPAAVDLHLDNLSQRRRPRATVTLDQASVLSVLDAECAAAGIGVVCIAARCEESPGKGVHSADAAALAAVVEELAPYFACDWRIHARVEITHAAALPALRDVLRVSSRVALVSVMEHTASKSRFASPEANRAFYAADWGVPLDEVDAILAGEHADDAVRLERRREVAALVRSAGVLLASHDDGTAKDVEAGHALGAAVSEFPLSLEAAGRARELGMTTVLGAPNAVRGRSTSPGNLLAADAVAAGLCDVLCSDYLPTSLQAAPHALAASGAAPLHEAIDLVSTAPARALGLPSPAIEVGRPLTASLRRVDGTSQVGLALWRNGVRTFHRGAAIPVRRAAVPVGA
jgi:alpha-D-ribose 1-methylphosphonate 5-triphosphate diphosphatase